jgi:hypothetical protein
VPDAPTPVSRPDWVFGDNAKPPPGGWKQVGPGPDPGWRLAEEPPPEPRLLGPQVTTIEGHFVDISDQFVPAGGRLDAEIKDAMMPLARIVLDNPNAKPLAGWEGTQYVLGPLRDRPGTAPRLTLDNFLDQLEAVVPTARDEILTGRRQDWAGRQASARIARVINGFPLIKPLRVAAGLLDTAFGARSEKDISKQARQRLKDILLADVQKEGDQQSMGFFGDKDVKTFAKAESQVQAGINHVHDQMMSSRGPIGGFGIYRRAGLIPDELLQQWFEEGLTLNGRNPLPAWYERFLDRNKGVAHPVAHAWLESENRIRAYFSTQDGGAAKMLSYMVEGVYDSRAVRKASSAARGLTVLYHTTRFLIDMRFLGLEMTEAAILTLSKEGPAALLEAKWGIRFMPDGKIKKFDWQTGDKRGRGAQVAPKELRPMDVPNMMGESDDSLARFRQQHSWWLAQAESGISFSRMRYLMAMVRKNQEAHLPREILKLARADKQIASMLESFGSTPAEWLKGLEDTWALDGALRHQKYLNPQDAAKMYQPMLDRGVINQAEFDEMVKAGKVTPNANIAAELAKMHHPSMTPMLERLQFINDQFWKDASELIFGQTDRSNMQRFVNHPLLWWPASYMVKATRWLHGILFERAFGHDTGWLGAYSLAALHRKHVELLNTDEEYRKQIAENPTLLMIAQMILPASLYDLGVGLSPMTQLGIQTARIAMTGEVPSDAYVRNFFNWGPFYTAFSLLPRAVGEVAQMPGIPGRIGQALEPIAPQTFTIRPSTSRLAQAEQKAALNRPFDVSPAYYDPSRRGP